MRRPITNRFTIRDRNPNIFEAVTAKLPNHDEKVVLVQVGYPSGRQALFQTVDTVRLARLVNLQGFMRSEKLTSSSG